MDDKELKWLMSLNSIPADIPYLPLKEKQPQIRILAPGFTSESISDEALKWLMDFENEKIRSS